MREAFGVFRYTILEALRKGTLLAYFLIGIFIITVFAVGIRLSPIDGVTVQLFGANIDPSEMEGFNIVDFLLFQLYNNAAGAILLFGLFGTAGMIPSFVEKGTAELFLSKPISRTNLFISRFTGAIGGITMNILFYTVGMWLVFGIKLGVWNWGFLASSLFTSYVFACFFSIAVLFGIITQSSGVAIIVGFVFTFLASLLEIRESFLYKIWDNTVYHSLLDILYYCTPQLDAMKSSAGSLIANFQTPSADEVQTQFKILPFVYSTLSACAMYALSILYFNRKDY